MKRLLIALLFIPFFCQGQDLTDLPKYHNSNELWEKSYGNDVALKAATVLNDAELSDNSDTLTSHNTRINTNLTSIDSSKVVFNYSDSTINSLDSMSFNNGASIDNHEPDTLLVTETVIELIGDVVITGHLTQTEHSSGQTSVSTPGTQTITTGGTFERMNGGSIAYTGDHTHDFTEDDGRLTYTRFNDISVTVTWDVSLQCGETTQVINVRIALNGTTIPLSNQRTTFSNQNDYDSFGGTRFIDMSENDYVELFITSDTNSDDIIVDNATLNVTTH